MGGMDKMDQCKCSTHVWSSQKVQIKFKKKFDLPNQVSLNKRTTPKETEYKVNKIMF